MQMGGVLRYRWEAYCDTNRRSTEVFPFPESSVAPKAQQYKLEAYCNTNWRCIAILFREVVVVGVSDILLTSGHKSLVTPLSDFCPENYFEATKLITASIF